MHHNEKHYEKQVHKPVKTDHIIKSNLLVK